MNGYQGGCLSRVHRQAGPGQTEGVGHPVGDDPTVEPRQGVARDGAVALLVEQGCVVACDGSHEYAGPDSREARGQDARIFDGLPAELEDQPLLRVHGDRFSGRDAEESRIEPVDVVEEAAGVGVGGGVPALGRGFGDGTLAVGEKPPEFFRRRRSRQPAGKPDDGDRFGRPGSCSGNSRFVAHTVTLSCSTADITCTEFSGAAGWRAGKFRPSGRTGVCRNSAVHPPWPGNRIPGHSRPAGC